MRKTSILAAAIAAMVLGSVALADEKETTIDKVPQNLRSAIDQKVAGGKVTEVSVEGEGAKQVWTIEFSKDGKTSEFTVDAAGAVKDEPAGGNNEGGGSELSKAPQAVQATAKRILGDHPCDGADKETEDGKAVYEVSYKVNGTDYAVIIGEDGGVVAQEIEVDPSVVPAKVADTLRKTQPDGKVKETSIVSAGGRLFYAYDVEVGGAMHEVRIGAGGKLISDTTATPEVAKAGGEKNEAKEKE